MSGSMTPGRTRKIRVCMHVLTTARLDPRVLREAVALADAGYAVTIVDVERDPKRPKREVLQGVTLKHIMMPSRFKRSGFRPAYLVKIANMLIWGALSVITTPADVYHAHDDNALLACYLAARLRWKKLIFDAHELPLVQPHHTRWKRLSAVARWGLRLMTPRCAGIITVSPPIADEFHRRYGGPPVTLVRNIPPFTPPQTSDRLREMLRLDSSIKIALYQGGIQENRRLDLLVNAAHFLNPGNHIIMMGNGESTEKLKAMTVADGVADRVHIIPAVPYEELVATTASADVGLIVLDGSYSLNQKWCLPNKLFECLMAGIPVISSQLDAVAELIHAYGVGVIVPSLAPEVVGRAINDVLADDAGRESMRRHALAAARQTFNWEAERYRLLGLYATVLKLPPPTPEDTLAPTLPRMSRVQ